MTKHSKISEQLKGLRNMKAGSVKLLMGSQGKEEADFPPSNLRTSTSKR